MTDFQLRLFSLGFHGLLHHIEDVKDKEWLPWLLDIEEEQRGIRSLERRKRAAKLGHFKDIADYDWRFPKKVDKKHIDELFTLSFIDDGANVVFLGPNGVGKTMLAKNLAFRCLQQGHNVLFTTASSMLNGLAAEDSASALERRLRRLCAPKVLCIDEVGYLSYGNRHADLLFEVVTRRYELHRPVIVTTNKAFREWAEVFPSAACVVTLVDRLVHRSEVVQIDGSSFRLKEATERKKKPRDKKK